MKLQKTFWWMSFFAEDTRSAIWPPPDGVLGYWCSGSSDEMDIHEIVFWCVAESEKEAKQLAHRCFPESRWLGRWRFCYRTNNSTPGDHWPLSDWMQQRYEAAISECEVTR